MNIVSDSFRWMEDSSGTWLCVKAKRREAERICNEAKAGRRYNVKIAQYRERRSLDSNAYAWVLIGKLSDKLNLSMEEIYRNYIKDVPHAHTVVPVREDMIDHWDKIWCSGHLGRMTRDLGPCRNLKGYHNMVSYISSSDYDTKLMSRFIELIVEDCKQYGIETLTPQELAAMNEEWGRKQDA